MRHTMQMKLIAALIGGAGLAMTAQAQEVHSKSQTTVVVSNGEGSYEIRIEDGELKAVKVDGKSVDPEFCELDQEAGFVVIHPEDGDPVVVDIPNMNFDVAAPFPSNTFIAQAPKLPRMSDPSDLIEWEDAPGTIFYDDGQVSWGGDGPPRVMVGITHDEVKEELREKLGLDEGEGIYVLEVREGLPAAKAGLKPGDVIIEAGGEHIDERGVLMEVLKEKEPGDRLDVIVLRKDKDGDVAKKKIRVKLAEYDHEALGANRFPGLVTVPDEGRFRLKLDELAPDFDQNMEFEFFDEFDFELPEEVEDLPPEVREEIERALEIARERAHDTQARALQLRIKREGMALEQAQRSLEQAIRSREQAMEQRHHQEAQDRVAKLREEGYLPEPMTEEKLARLREEGFLPKGQIKQGLNFEDHSLKELREQGIDIQKLMDDELERLHELSLKLDRLGSNEQIIRSAPGGRAFIIERDADSPRSTIRNLQRADREGGAILELRSERDDLQRRNQELERRVDDLEQKLEALMRKLEKSQ